MSYKTPEPAIAHAFPEPKQQALVRRVYERLTNMESVASLQSFSNGRKSPVPPKAKLEVTVNPIVPASFFVKITNPEFLPGHSNPIAAPIRHWLQASPYKNFAKQVTNFPITHQTYFSVTELGPGTFYFKLRSTFDGKTFNDPVQSDPYSPAAQFGAETSFTKAQPLSVPIIFSRGGTMLNPSAPVNVVVWYAPFACTVTHVFGYVDGATGSVINARVNGTLELLASNLTLGAADVWTDGGTVQNAAIGAGSKLEIMVISVSGAPTQIAVEIQCTKP